MYKQQWSYYLETPRRTTKPIKIDLILKKRMESFIKTRIRLIGDDSEEFVFVKR